MDKMKMRFTNAVASRLSAAPHSTAKTELIEELSDNLYRRYQDMVAGGMEENAAFEQSLDELGDVDELLDYLKGLDPEEELPRLTLHPYEEQEQVRSGLDDILDSVDEIVKDAMDQAKEALDRADIKDGVQQSLDDAKDALRQAKDALRQAKDAMRQAGQSHWRSEDGRVEINFGGNDNGHGKFRFGDDRRDGKAPSRQGPDFTVSPDGNASPDGGTEGGRGWNVSIDNSDEPDKKQWQFSFGYDKAKGGFFAESSNTFDASSGSIPSLGLRGVDIQTVNGDVTIHLLDGADDDIRLEGDVDQLEVKVTEKGVLAIRQGKTASSSFFFLRGLSSADVELYLPRRPWEFIQVSAVNGDVTLDDGFELERLSVRTTSGDLFASCAVCGRLYFKSSSGDARLSGLTGSAQLETMSGDVRIQGHMDQVSLSSMSGDVELEGSAEQARLSSMSGDVRLEASILPQAMELSSKSGNCQARIPDTGPFTVRCKTTSGEIRSDFYSGVLRRNGAITRRGPEGQTGPTFTMSTISGDVELWKY